MNLVKELSGRIKANRDRPIVVIGDTMVDRWVHGHADQCQDGCLKFVEKSRVEVPGGAANAARCLNN